MNNITTSVPEREVEFSEALATWSIRYVSKTKFECILSIQANSGIQVLAKAEDAITHLVKAGCVPLHSASQNNNGSKAEPIIEVKQENLTEPRVCPIHHVPMKLWQKSNRSWYSHRTPTGWCKGVVS